MEETPSYPKPLREKRKITSYAEDNDDEDADEDFEP